MDEEAQIKSMMEVATKAAEKAREELALHGRTKGGRWGL